MSAYDIAQILLSEQVTDPEEIDRLVAAFWAATPTDEGDDDANQ